MINLFSEPFPPTALRRWHAQMVRDSTSSYTIDYVIVIKNFLNTEGHRNPISGSKVPAILLKGWIFPIGRASSGRVCAYSLRSRLVWIRRCLKFTSGYNVSVNIIAVSTVNCPPPCLVNLSKVTCQFSSVHDCLKISPEWTSGSDLSSFFQFRRS